MSDDLAGPRPVDRGDSTVPSQHRASHGSVSLLFPFDVGGTYVVEGPVVETVLEREAVNQQWQQALPEWNVP